MVLFFAKRLDLIESDTRVLLMKNLAWYTVYSQVRRVSNGEHECFHCAVLAFHPYFYLQAFGGSFA